MSFWYNVVLRCINLCLFAVLIPHLTELLCRVLPSCESHNPKGWGVSARVIISRKDVGIPGVSLHLVECVWFTQSVWGRNIAACHRDQALCVNVELPGCSNVLRVVICLPAVIESPLINSLMDRSKMIIWPVVDPWLCLRIILCFTIVLGTMVQQHKQTDISKDQGSGRSGATQ